MVNELAPHAMKCLRMTPHEEKSIARCAQKYTGTGVTNFGVSRYGRKSTMDRNDRDSVIGFHHSTPEDLLQGMRYMLPEVSPAGRSLDGYITLDQFCGAGLLEARLSDPLDFRTHGSITGIEPTLDRRMCFYTAMPCGSQEGISNRTACHRAGCCYDRTREKKCFAKYGPIVLAGTNTSVLAGNCPDSDRQNDDIGKCGSQESTEQECLALGCCYDAEKQLCYRRGSLEPPPVQIARNLTASRDHVYDLLGERALRPEVLPWCEELITNSTGTQRHVLVRVTLPKNDLCANGLPPQADGWTLVSNPEQINELLIELDGFEQHFVASNGAFFDRLVGTNVLLAFNRDALDEYGPLPAADFVLSEFFERGYVVRVGYGSDFLTTGDQLRETLDGRVAETLHMFREPPFFSPESTGKLTAARVICFWCFILWCKFFRRKRCGFTAKKKWLTFGFKSKP